ncbi:hypothetical protein [Pontibacter sp. G13]|uniref:hypothetical protein n=1 Tax=Pontibacter sp. G13 TaxID=3074898 RepID=UPI00288B49FF|nr:hypothetical protein [Pontibacter sp. G13]WNJ17769.1 hypothetical protein RJD25_23195 [Pontibacter sp. G13]
MSAVNYWLLLFGLICIGTPVLSQELSLGARMGTTPQTVISDSGKSVLPNSHAGLSVTYTRQRSEMDVNLQVQMQKAPEEGAIVRVPLTVGLPVDKKKRVKLRAGTFAEFEGNPGSKTAKKVRVGVTTGIDVNIPLTKKLVLVTETRLRQDLNGQMVQSDTSYVAPAKNLQFSISLGLSWKLKQGKEKKTKKPSSTE